MVPQGDSNRKICFEFLHHQGKEQSCALRLSDDTSRLMCLAYLWGQHGCMNSAVFCFLYIQNQYHSVRISWMDKDSIEWSFLENAC